MFQQMLPAEIFFSQPLFGVLADLELLALAKAAPPAHCSWGWSRKSGIKAQGTWKAKSITTPAPRCSRMWSLEENFRGDPRMKSRRAECLAALAGVPVLGSQLGILTPGQIPARC